MIRGLFLLAVCLLTLSCVSLANDVNNSSKKIDADLKKHFAVTERCTSFWEEEINKWKSVNGESFHSVKSVRKAIIDDDISLFSLFVREVWKYQEMSGNARAKESIGRWPVTSDEYRAATPFVFVTKFDSIPDDCMATVWLEPSILNLFNDSEKKVIEAGGIDLVEPYTKKWAIYWVFVNTKS